MRDAIAEVQAPDVAQEHPEIEAGVLTEHADNQPVFQHRPQADLLQSAEWARPVHGPVLDPHQLSEAVLDKGCEHVEGCDVGKLPPPAPEHVMIARILSVAAALEAEGRGNPAEWFQLPPVPSSGLPAQLSLRGLLSLGSAKTALPHNAISRCSVLPFSEGHACAVSPVAPHQHRVALALAAMASAAASPLRSGILFGIAGTGSIGG